MDNFTTPGPWKVLGGTVIVTDNLSNRFIASVPEADSSRFYEVRANARLIAAAPRLLYSCKMACEFIEKMISQWSAMDDEYLEDKDRAMLDDIRVAITEAEGGK